MRRGTRDFWREGRRTAGYSFLDFLHGYVYGRWPNLYIGLATGERRPPRLLAPWIRRLGRRASGGNAWADAYHGKVMPTPVAERLVTLREPVTLRGLEQIIPYPLARDIVLRAPDHIVALECPCRSVRPDPCAPLDVCLIVGEPFARFVADHHPNTSRWVSQDEAVEILRAERDRGHVHHAFFKDAMLGRFYAICNCCSCCCGAMHAHRTGTPMLASSGYVAVRGETPCAGCGHCASICPFEAISMEGDRPRIDLEKCMGCGVCVTACRDEALHLHRAPDRGIPLDMEVLLFSHEHDAA